MTRPPVLPLVAAALLLVGCNGDDDTAPTTVTATGVETTVGESTMTTSNTTAEPQPTVESTSTTTTTVAATTVPDTTVENTTTEPAPTTGPDGVPPRVTFPDDPDKQAIVDAAYAYFDALRAASAATTDAGLRKVLQATMIDPLAERVHEFLDQLVANDERVVANPEQPSYLEIFEPTVIVVDTVATFDTCAVDADIRIDVDGNSVDDSISSAAQTYNFTLVDGTWRVSDISRFGQYEGPIGCG